jgi:glutamine synthetase
MWVARYILQRLAEKYGINIEYHCKPLGNTDWNGSGMHANFSTLTCARGRQGLL